MSVKNLILKAKDIKLEEINLTEFGIPEGSVFLKSIGAKRFSSLSEKSMTLKDGIDKKDAKPEDYEMSDDFVYKLIVESVCDVDGVLQFEHSDIPALEERSSAMVMTLGKAINSLNSFSKENIDKAEKK